MPKSSIAPSIKSKTIALWLAFLGGGLGAHRFYLAGFSDFWGWLHTLIAALGFLGGWRWSKLGQDDSLAALLLICLGLSLSGAQGLAIWYGLLSDERWDQRFNQGRKSQASNWVCVLGLVLTLAVSATILVTTLAFIMLRSAEYSLAFSCIQVTAI